MVRSDLIPPESVDVRIYDDSNLDDSLALELRQLMTQAFRSHFSDTDWEHSLGGYRVTAALGGHIVASAAVVEREIVVGKTPHRAGYVEAVATNPINQGHGVGSAVMTVINGLVAAHFDLGVLSTSRHTFYERLGWQRWRGPSYVISGVGTQRTVSEDDGLMALIQPGQDINPTQPISCHQRSGDDW